MKKICYYVQDVYLNNRIFDPNDQAINRNDILASSRELRGVFKERGYSLDTQDITLTREAVAVFYMEMPHVLPKINEKKKSYLFACETELINPRNWVPKYLSKFHTVFTVVEYSNDVSNFIKINYPQKFRLKPNLLSFNQKKLCTMIAGGKISFHSKQLYFERIKWINWFTKNHPDKFDFYGTGWKRLIALGPLYVRAFNKLKFVYNLLRPDMQLYKGLADDKYETLNKYKFSICYENAKDINGNLTEKIFDCFFSNNVPIYLGAKDILKYIPKDCFIYAEDFNSFDEIFHFINKMPESQYLQYLKNADLFLNSEEFKKHSINQFAHNIADKIINDLEHKN